MTGAPRLTRVELVPFGVSGRLSAVDDVAVEREPRSCRSASHCGVEAEGFQRVLGGAILLLEAGVLHAVDRFLEEDGGGDGRVVVEADLVERTVEPVGLVGARFVGPVLGVQGVGGDAIRLSVGRNWSTAWPLMRSRSDSEK